MTSKPSRAARATIGIACLAGCLATAEDASRLGRRAEYGNSFKLRQEACEELGWSRDTAAVRILLRLIEQEELEWCAAQSLGRLGDAGASDALKAHLVLRGGGGLNRMAVWALAEVGDTLAIPQLVALHDSLWLSRQDSLAVAAALRLLGGHPGDLP